MINLNQSHSSVLNVQVRWLLGSDLTKVLRIEQESIVEPWSREDFLAHLRERYCIGMVAEHEGQIAGYMIYELNPQSLDILRFVVAPAWQRMTVGTQLMRHLMRKLSEQRRNTLTATVRESSLSAQLFLRAQQFRCVSVIKDYFSSTDEDAYWFQYRNEKAEIALSSRKSLIESQPALLGR